MSPLRSLAALVVGLTVLAILVGMGILLGLAWQDREYSGWPYSYDPNALAVYWCKERVVVSAVTLNHEAAREVCEDYQRQGRLRIDGTVKFSGDV